MLRDSKTPIVEDRNDLETKVECRGSGYKRSCLYKNLYYYYNHFRVLTVNGSVLPPLKVRLGMRINSSRTGPADQWNLFDYDPPRRLFRTYADLERFVHTEVVPHLIPDLTVYFKQPWHFNIGHALFDGLYPAYMSLTLFPPRHLQPFRSLIDLDNNTCSDCWSEDVTRHFSGLGLMKERVLKGLSTQRWYVFDELIMGNGDMGQRCIQPNYQLGGGVDGDGSRLFRDRMYQRHGLLLPVVRQSHSAEHRRLTTPLKAYVIDNKRFSVKDITEINAAVDEINNYTIKRANYSIKYLKTLPWPLIHVVYLNYRDVKAQISNYDRFNITETSSGEHSQNLLENDFVAQLKLLRDMDIHITGPGTAQMYQTFLPDGSVTINLGRLRKISSQNRSILYPSFMEQYMTAGTPYIQGFYYPINKRKLGLQRYELVKLIREAGKRIMDGFRIPVDPHNNLAADGQLFKEMCATDQEFCQSVTSRDLDRETACLNFWAEDMVHGLEQWSAEGSQQSVNGTRCPLNRTLLATLKQKYDIQ